RCIPDCLNTPAHAAKALEMARKSMVLLKNDGILPLSPSQKIMVVGPNADDSVMQWGNYNGTPAHTVTILEGIRRFIPDVPSVRGCALTGGLGEQSVFDHLASGLYARFFNGHGTSRTPRSVAEAMYSTPVALDGGGATVFAPGVSLTDFEAELRGLFIVPEDGDFILTVSASPGQHKVTLGDVTTREFAPDGTLAIPFSATRGEKIPVSIDFCHFDGDASLSVDILNARKQSVSYDDADIILFVGGISPRLEGEEMRVTVPGFRGGDRETIELPRAQRDLIRSLADAGKKIVMVNCSGSAVALAPEDSVCSAILQAWYPGQAGGQAVAEVLFGAYNPGGRLPVTFYRDDSQLPDFEDYSMAGRTYRYMDAEPLYPFGHGLSYTTFSYGTPRFSSTTIAPGETITVTIPVTNTGSMDGDEVVMAYVKNPADPAGPRRSLRAFSRTHIPAGKTVDVTFELTPDTFTTFDYATSRMLPLPGTYILQLPDSSHTITLTP
ncbi:MAG: glycoside hydrolase family 3 C-terminal domain-containing protein, partial [Muribaculaceae bacterium]|nr:glycoside hydrolase family 3 C-terminal domain-containing protein [Muribaculaceae bacterium]